MVGLTGPLVFVALGSLLAGLLISLGLLDAFNAAYLLLALSVLSSVVLWLPAQQALGPQESHVSQESQEAQEAQETQETQETQEQQQTQVPPEVEATMVGKIVTVTSSITRSHGRVSDGIETWPARLDESSSAPIGIDCQVQVMAVDGDVLEVKSRSV
jgi:membrane protein implicated in regulation of membrane protease activity